MYSGGSTPTEGTTTVRYTAPQAAEALQDLLRRADGSAPNISRDDIKALAAANLLTNRSATSIPRFDAVDIKHLGGSVRYVEHSEICGLAAAGLVYKVSVLPRPRVFHEDGSWGWEPNPVHGVDGRLLRDQMGVDYSENPLGRTALGGFEGVWPISAKNADALAQNGGLLLASCKGYVGPAKIRTVVDHLPVDGSTRRYLVTQPVPAEVEDFLGLGLWIDGKGGPISTFL